MVDESSQLNKKNAEGGAGSASSDALGGAAAGGDVDESAEGGESQREREDRANRAKAFYRAMYAGEDVAPTDFGMGNQGGGGGGGERGGGAGGPCANCARLESHANDLEARTLEAENHYKRMAADFENYRRRVDREKEEFQGIGVSKAVEAILPALDDMDRAKQSLANVTDPAAILSSLDLVFNRFAKCLEAIGVKQMAVVGEQFDPRLHEPVQEIETQEFADNAVVHELRRGYLIKDKVLRPSLVNVASNPSGVVIKKEAPAQTEEAQAEAAKQEDAPAAAESQAPVQAEAPAEAKPEPEVAPAAEQKAEEPKAEAPRAEEPKSEEPKAEEPKSEAPKSEAPKAEELKTEAPASAATQPAAASPAEAKPAQATEESQPKPEKRPQRDTKSRAKQSETAELPGNIFDATATADLPIFEIDQIGQGLFSTDDDDFEQLTSKPEGETYEIGESEAPSVRTSDKTESGKESDE